MPRPVPLTDLGWRPVHQQQLDLDDLEQHHPARVVGIERSHLRALDDAGEHLLAITGPWRSATGSERLAVGDWLLLDGDRNHVVRRLERQGLLQRRAAGAVAEMQPIAANLDTLFLVTSANSEFNPSRLERWLAIALEAGAEPVVVLSKADLCADTAPLEAAARRLRAGLVVEAVNALDPASVAVLTPWLGRGQTIALVGSSGVGKSTLLNTLLGEERQATGAIREHDAHGRHTTTRHELFPLASGALLLDSPGLRELRLADADAGLAAAFDDIAALAANCRFGDCSHDAEPGCAVQAAIAAGDLEPRRLANWRKLLREDLRNSQAVHERHAAVRRWSKQVRASNRARDKRR